MRELIIKNSKGKRVLFLFILTNLVYVVMLAVTIPKVMQFADGMKLLDMLPGGYNYEYVKMLFTALGENGRHAYLFVQIPVDMIYPLLFALSFCLVLAFFLRKLNKLNSPFFYFSYLPVIAGFSDYAENIGIITMLNQFPDITILAVKTSNLFSILKSTSTTIYFVVLLIVVLIVGIKKMKSGVRI